LGTWGSFTGNFEKERKRGSGNEASPSLYGSCATGIRREGSFTGYSEGYIKKALSVRTPLGEPGGVAGLPRTLRDSESGLCKWSVSLCGNCVRGNVDGGLLYWESGKLRKTCQGRPWKLSISLPLSLYTGSVRETWREGSYTEDSERHVIEGSGNGAFIS